jgi:hypothetical protein
MTNPKLTLAPIVCTESQLRAQSPDARASATLDTTVLMATARLVLRIPPQTLDPLPKLLASASRTIMVMPEPVLLDAVLVLPMVSLMLKQHQGPLSLLTASARRTPMEPMPVPRAQVVLAILPPLLDPLIETLAFAKKTSMAMPRPVTAQHARVAPLMRKLLPWSRQLVTALAKPTTTLLELPANAQLAELGICQMLERQLVMMQLWLIVSIAPRTTSE